MLKCKRCKREIDHGDYLYCPWCGRDWTKKEDVKTEEYIFKLFENYKTESKDWNALLTSVLNDIKRDVERYKRIAKVNLDDLKKYVQQDKELKENLGKIFTAIVKEPVEKPVMLYKFKEKPMTEKDLAEWYDCVELYYHFAQRYEEQERGSCCCVDRAYSRYLIPECKKLLERLGGDSNSSHR